jgi:hypothetical protein
VRVDEVYAAVPAHFVAHAPCSLALRAFVKNVLLNDFGRLFVLAGLKSWMTFFHFLCAL